MKLTAICIIGRAGDDRRVMIRAGLNVYRVVAVASLLNGGPLLDLKAVRFCSASQARLVVRLCNYRLGQGWLAVGAPEALAVIERVAGDLDIALVSSTEEQESG